MISFRAQSAMEYLMTYGWAILIIAVVLGALFSLGVFSGANLLGTSCIASPGYFCQNIVLTTAGNLQFTFGQNTGVTLYNLQLACASTSNSLGLPNSGNLGGGSATSNTFPNGFGTLQSAGTVSNVVAATGISLLSGQTISITALPCYGASGASAAPLGTQSIGAGFSGYVWMNYTTGSGAVSSATNPYLTQKILTVSVKVS